MSLNLADYETKAIDAIKAFWGNRSKSRQKQVEAGKIDAGERGSVTTGKNMDGFISLITDIIVGNGLELATIHRNKRLATLPGFFRPTKVWDLVVIKDERLIAAIELKSQVGSFGNNFNNRTEEAIGSALDFWTTYREGGFGNNSKPFLGWLILVEDAPKSRRPVRDRSVHFPVFSEFKDACYLDRYNMLCRKLMQEKLYDIASVISSPKTAIDTGDYNDMDHFTGLKSLVVSLAGHIAGEAVR